MGRCFGRHDAEPDDTEQEQPLRAELYSIEQLERHAKVVAMAHTLAAGRGDDRLLPRLDDNECILIATYDLVAAAADDNRRIEPAAEWLLDNFYLIEEQIRAIRRLLPPAYSQELPRLSTGGLAGFPRVYDIALEFIAHVVELKEQLHRAFAGMPARIHDGLWRRRR